MRISHGRSGRPFDSRRARSKWRYACRKVCSVRSSASWWLPDPVVRVRVDVAQVGAVELLEGAVELGLVRRRVGRLRSRASVAYSRTHRQTAPRACPSSCRPPSRAPRGAARRPTRRRRSRPRPAPRGPRGRAPRYRRRRPPRRGAARSRVPPRPGRSGPGSARRERPAEQLAGAAVAAAGASTVAVRSPTPASPEKVSSARRPRRARSDALAPDSGGGDPGGVQAVRLGGRGGESGGVLRDACDLDADDVLGALADQPGAVEDLAELRPQVRVGRAQDQRRLPPAASRAWAGPAEAGDRARAHALGHVLAGQRAERLHESLAQQQDRGAGADAVAERADRRRQRLRGDGEADEVAAGELDVGRALDGDRFSGSSTPGR